VAARAEAKAARAGKSQARPNPRALGFGKEARVTQMQRNGRPWLVFHARGLLVSRRERKCSHAAVRELMATRALTAGVRTGSNHGAAPALPFEVRARCQNDTLLVNLAVSFFCLQGRVATGHLPACSFFCRRCLFPP
jgi:hypothetical protein